MTSDEHLLPIEWRLPFMLGRSPLSRLLSGQAHGDLIASLESEVRREDRKERSLSLAVIGLGWLATALACAALSAVLAVMSAIFTGHPVTTWPTTPMVVGLPSAAGGIALMVGGLSPPRLVPVWLLRLLFDFVFVAVLCLMVRALALGKF